MPCREAPRHVSLFAAGRLLVAALAAAPACGHPDFDGSATQPLRLDVEASLLEEDDQCGWSSSGDSGEQCALSALQLRSAAQASKVAQTASEDTNAIAAARDALEEGATWAWPWGGGSVEKCCQCVSGQVSWSASGQCTFCKEKVARRGDVPKECQLESPNYIGSKACEAKCVQSMVKRIAPAETAGEASPSQFNLQAPGHRQLCCRCTNGIIGWSASGKCKVCRGSVETVKDVASDCVIGSPNFAGKTDCAKACKKLLSVSDAAQETEMLADLMETAEEHYRRGDQQNREDYSGKVAKDRPEAGAARGTALS